MNDTCSVDGAMNDFIFSLKILNIFELNDLTSDEISIDFIENVGMMKC